jgi:hypothetical protein
MKKIMLEEHQIAKLLRNGYSYTDIALIEQNEIPAAANIPGYDADQSKLDRLAAGGTEGEVEQPSWGDQWADVLSPRELELGMSYGEMEQYYPEQFAMETDKNYIYGDEYEAGQQKYNDAMDTDQPDSRWSSSSKRGSWGPGQTIATRPPASDVFNAEYDMDNYDTNRHVQKRGVLGDEGYIDSVSGYQPYHASNPWNVTFKLDNPDMYKGDQYTGPSSDAYTRDVDNRSKFTLNTPDLEIESVSSRFDKEVNNFLREQDKVKPPVTPTIPNLPKRPGLNITATPKGKGTLRATPKISEDNHDDSPANPGTGQYELQPGDDNLREMDVLEQKRKRNSFSGY